MSKEITLGNPKDGYVRVGDGVLPLFECGQFITATSDDGEIAEYVVERFDWRRGVLTVRERGGAL